jgi:hypothetical protein
VDELLKWKCLSDDGCSGSNLFSIKNHWVSGLCPSSGILKLENTMFRRLDASRPSSEDGNGSSFHNVFSSLRIQDNAQSPETHWFISTLAPCVSQSIGTAVCAFLVYPSRPFWGCRSCWTKAPCSRDQVVGGSRLLDGCLERAWTDTVSVSKPLACPRLCNCKYDVAMN